jgi:hypothetical protein
VKTIFRDLWEIHSTLKDGEYIAITTNGATRKNDGYAVMGRGCALEATQRFPDIQRRLGTHLLSYGNHVFCCPEYKLFTFPVKVSWEMPADLNLISKSCQELVEEIKRKKVKYVYLVFPGVGNGRRAIDEVLPVLEPILGNAPVALVRRPSEKP